MATASISSKASGSKRKVTSAAVVSASKNKKTKASSNEDGAIPLGKALASTEKRTRDFAVRSLTTYLSTNGAHTIPPLELAKLWKGLFYCFWMSDKPLIQQRLANDLASLVLIHPSNSSSSSADNTGPSSGERAQAGLTFLEGFWTTLVEEWSGLDKHRIDKFYLLVRRFVSAGFQLLAEEKWPLDAVTKFQEILGKFEGVLSTNNPKVPDSLTYHLSDVYLDELEKVIQKVHDSAANEGLEDEGEEEQEEGEQELVLVPTLELLMPFVDALATAKSKAMYERIWGNVFEPLLEDTLRASARDDQDDDDTSDEDEDQDEEAQDDQDDAEDDEQEEEEGGDETANGTEFHSFADESGLDHNESSSEPSLISESDSDNGDEDEEQDDVRYPLLLALSSVTLPTPSNDDDADELETSNIDVALMLRKSIFQALFTAASRKDATEARRRWLYQLWRDEQDRLNDLHANSSDEDEDEDEDEE